MERPLNFDFVVSVCYKKLGSCLKPTVPKSCSDALSHLEDIVNKVCTVELEPIVVVPISMYQGTRMSVDLKSIASPPDDDRAVPRMG